MSQNSNIPYHVRRSLKRAHKKALAADSYLFSLEEEVWHIAKKFGKLEVSKRREIHSEFGRISWLSKQNRYSTRQYLKLLAQLIEGIATESQSERNV